MFGCGENTLKAQKVHEYKLHNIKIQYELTKYDENSPKI